MAIHFRECRAEPPKKPADCSSGDRPGDDFNQCATWDELLQPEGWALIYERDEIGHWRRPGKDVGISATTNFGGSDLFYCFTTSTEFDANRAYDKFSAYTYLHHGGDFGAAAKDLADQGYGDGGDDNAQATAELSEEERTERRDAAWGSCGELGSAPRILDRFGESMEGLGVVGEYRVTRLLYFAIVSRLFRRPVSVVVKGPSSGGKSWVTEMTLKHFPTSAYYALSAMSERALVYSKEPLKHRMLVFYEASGMAGELQSYLVRTLLSEGRLRYETVGKNLQTILIEREGPTGALITTTQVSLHPENETRLVSVTVDDSTNQTAVVMQSAARRYERDVRSADDPAMFGEWLEFQRWIELGGHDVLVPYARALAKEIPPVATRLRRDFSALLTLVEAHALLHQVNRDRDERGRIVATLDDYAIVRELVVDLFAEAAGKTVPDAVRDTVEVVRELTAGSGPVARRDTVSVRQVADELGLDISTASRRVKKALSGGYLENLEPGRGRPYKLKLGAPVPADVSILPEVGQLEACRPWESEAQGFSAGNTGENANPCSVASGSEGEVGAA